jgi:hypothetical protein
LGREEKSKPATFFFLAFRFFDPINRNNGAFSGRESARKKGRESLAKKKNNQRRTRGEIFSDPVRPLFKRGAPTQEAAPPSAWMPAQGAALLECGISAELNMHITH